MQDTKDYGHYPSPDTFEVEIDDDKLWSFICDNRARVVRTFDQDILKYLNAETLCDTNTTSTELSEKIRLIDMHISNMRQEWTVTGNDMRIAIKFILEEMKEAYEGQL